MPSPEIPVEAEIEIRYESTSQEPLALIVSASPAAISMPVTSERRPTSSPPTRAGTSAASNVMTPTRRSSTLDNAISINWAMSIAQTVFHADLSTKDLGIWRYREPRPRGDIVYRCPGVSFRGREGRFEPASRRTRRSSPPGIASCSFCS